MMRVRARLFAAMLAASIATVCVAQPKPEHGDETFQPTVGQPGKDVVWVPTPDALVTKMLQATKVTKDDLVYDLGSGDGKIPIAAAKSFGAKAVGIEYNADMAELARRNVRRAGVQDQVTIITGDIFVENFTRATVVTMYLLPELNLKLRPLILAMKPGTRVTSHQFTMSDWEADQTAEIEYRTAYLWIVPARVDGTWTLKDAGGASYTVNLNQNFQKITGDVVSGSAKQPLVNASLSGDDIRFAFNDDKGVTRNFTGTVRGGELIGTLKSAAGESKTTAVMQGKPRAAAWAEMPSQCGRFYGK